MAIIVAVDENEAEEDRSFTPPPSSSPPPPPPSPPLQPPASPPPRPRPIPSLHPRASPPPVLDMSYTQYASKEEEEEEDDPRPEGVHAAAWLQAQAGPAAETGRDVGLQGIEEGYGGGGRFGGGGVARAEDAEVRRRGPRQPYRCGYTEGQTKDKFGRPHRPYERHSGTQRGYGMKRDGAGRGNSTHEGLAQENVDAVNAQHTVAMTEKNPEEEAQTKAEKVTEGAGNEDEEKEAHDNMIPTDIHPQTKKSCVETVLTLMHAGGKFGASTSSYSVAGGLDGVGLSIVNALSEALEVTVCRDGKEYRQSYSRGKPLTTLSSTRLSDESSSRQGSCIRFWPDKEIFTTTIEFDFNTISSRIRELAFLNPELRITLTKEEEDAQVQHNEYCYAGGLVEYVAWLNTDKKPLHDPIAFRKELDGIIVDVSLQWCSDSYSDTVLGYANSIRTIDGGTHIEGLKTSLTRTINNLAKKSKTIKDKDISLSWEHVREGMTCIISVKVPNPEFEGQTKTRLGNPEVRKIVEQSVQENLTEYLELNPDVLDSILSKSLNALKAASAAKWARELVRTKSVLKSSSLPGKLADCASSDLAESEIFIVEGDSAGGSAKQGRDRKFQELPERLLLTYKPEESDEVSVPDPVEEERPPVEESVPVHPVTEVVSPCSKTVMADTGDLLEEYEKVKDGAENEEEEKQAEDNEQIEISITENLNIEEISRNQVISNYISGKIVVKFPPEMDRSVLFLVSRWNEIDYTASPRADRELFKKIPILTSKMFPEGFDLLRWIKKNGYLPLPLNVRVEVYEDPRHKLKVNGVTMHFVVVSIQPTSLSDIRNVVITIPFPGLDHSGNERRTRKHIWKNIGTHVELESSLEWKIPSIAATDRSAELCVDAFCYDGLQHPCQFFPIRVHFSYDRSMGSKVAHVLRTLDGRGLDFRQNTVARGNYVVYHPNELARRAAESADKVDAWQQDWGDDDDFV